MKGQVTEQADAEITPVTMNDRTATNDLLLIRANPQIPCPVVHPFPNFVPNPTKKPPTMKAKGEAIGTVDSP